MTDDATLLRRYLDERSQAAFAQLVERHVDLVYGVAWRRLGGDTHRAEDVAQTVFARLARKAPELRQRVALAGWLHTTAVFVARETLRQEYRRRRHEQEARLMEEVLAPTTPVTDWERLRPVIDDALAELDEPDREAVLLRFFSGRKFAEIGTVLRLSEDAARMRVDRALDKLHPLLARRGVTSTSAALAVILSQGAIAAPLDLAAKATGAALAGVTISVISVGFWSNVVNIPNAIIGAVAAVVVLGVGVAFHQSTELGPFDAASVRERVELATLLDQAERRVAALEARRPPITGATTATSPARPVVAGGPLTSPEAVARVAAALPLGRATHVAFVIDTSGSMRDPATHSIRASVIEQLWAVFITHPHISFVQVLDVDGRNILGRPDEWLGNQNITRDLIARALFHHPVASNSDPSPGMIRAMRSRPEPGNVTPVMSVVVLGDEFAGDEDAVAARVQQINPRDATGHRQFSINVIGFRAHVPEGTLITSESPSAKYAQMMRRIAAENDGVFVEAP